ncbi:glycosyltransferase family 39 protein [Phycomyces nitens]|nr:glycosyltransferase family 39 protein [Phycomyces nitens]
MEAPSSLRRRRVTFESSETQMGSMEDTDNLKEYIKTKAGQLYQETYHRIALTVITVLAFFITFYKIWYPAQVVFDEVHFGKFAGFYLKRSFFFDVHPPLAKLMIAGAGYLLDYDGHYNFDKIGESYIENNVPYIGMRALPAILNVFSASLMYSIMKQSGYSVVTCTLVAGMYTLDNSLVAQHRLILLDSMLIFYMLGTVYAYIRFHKQRHWEFSVKWWSWLILSGVMMAMTLSVKMVGLFIVATVGVSVLVDLWRLLDLQRGLSMGKIMKHFLARVFALIIIPTAVYVFWFYVHFNILDHSGPGDSMMSPLFQSTLKSSPLLMKTLDIHYYDTISIMHKETSVYLHSHNMSYPLRYPDGRISSKGQQVTGIKKPNENSYWRVKPTKEISIDTKTPVRHGDVIQLEHVGTGTNLLTHNVASTLMPTNQEVRTVPLGERHEETLFVVYLNDKSNGNIWQTHRKPFRLLHKSTAVAIWTHRKPLPDWGLGHQEVNGNKKNSESTNYWIADEIFGVNATEVNSNKKGEIGHLPFWKKFAELQIKMLSQNSKLTKSHPYQTSPLEWPLMLRGISYWTNSTTKEQIYMTGNIAGWWLAFTAVVFLVGLLILDMLAKRRNYEPILPAIHHRLTQSGGFFLLLFILHYVPFYGMGRTLFLHHYLPAVTASYLLLGSVFQYIFIDGIDMPISSYGPTSKYKRETFITARPSLKTYIAAIIIIAMQLSVFIFLSPITYGTQGLTPEEVTRHKVLKSWDLAFGTNT